MFYPSIVSVTTKQAKMKQPFVAAVILLSLSIRTAFGKTLIQQTIVSLPVRQIAIYD
jgi:hypothetical protein